MMVARMCVTQLSMAPMWLPAFEFDTNIFFTIIECNNILGFYMIRGITMRHRLTVRNTVVALMMVTCCGCAMPTAGATRATVRFNCEERDTTEITNLLIAGTKESGGAAWFGRQLIGKPYAAHTLDIAPEMLTVNMDGFDCTTFTETALALRMTIAEGRSLWIDFIHNLEKIRYKGGECRGYGSRLHYVSQWVIDGTHRGILREVTDLIGPADYAIKTLDFMSSHRDKYEMLADSANYADVKRQESGLRGHRYAYIKTANIGKTQLRENDVVAVVSGLKALDVEHLGIVTIVDGKPHLLHASSKEGKVTIDKRELQEYMRQRRTSPGIRVFRLTE